MANLSFIPKRTLLAEFFIFQLPGCISSLSFRKKKCLYSPGLFATKSRKGVLTLIDSLGYPIIPGF